MRKEPKRVKFGTDLWYHLSDLLYQIARWRFPLARSDGFYVDIDDIRVEPDGSVTGHAFISPMDETCWESVGGGKLFASPDVVRQFRQQQRA